MQFSHKKIGNCAFHKMKRQSPALRGLQSRYWLKGDSIEERGKAGVRQETYVTVAVT